MNGFEEQLKKAEQYLRPESFDVCSILCGRMMALVLRELLQKYLQEATPAERSSVRKEISSLKKQSTDSLTAGEMAILFDKCNILRSFASIRKINMEDPRQPDLRTMVRIRNKATHDNAKDTDLEKADAHVMYGSVLRLATIADRLLSQPAKKELSEGTAVAQQERAPTRRIIDGTTPPAPPMASDDTLTLYRNRASGKHFVFLEKEDSGKLLLAIPTGQIKALDRHLFESAVEVEEEEAVSRGLILEEQAKRYHEYVEAAQQNGRDETKREKARPGQAEEVFAYEVHGARA